MIAGGVGSVREEHVNALPFPEGTALVVLGGPAMLIGLGGGAIQYGVGYEFLRFGLRVSAAR